MARLGTYTHLRLILVTTLTASMSLSACGGSTMRLSSPQYLPHAATPFAPPTEIASAFQAVQAAGARAHHTLEADEVLTRVARAVASRVAADSQHRVPSTRVVQSLSWSGGLIDPTPSLRVLAKTSGDVTNEELATLTDSMLNDAEYNAVGVAHERINGVDVGVVMTLVRKVTLADPVNRTMSHGATLRINGSVSTELRNPEVSVTDQDGKSESFPLGEGPDFSTAIPLAHAGAMQVEILATGAHGSSVYAHFPVYVDSQPPATPEDQPPAAVIDAAQAERELLEQVNALRTKRGLAALQLQPVLAEVSRRHSSDMAQNHFVSYTSPTHGTEAARLLAANFRISVVRENIARGYSVQDIQDGFVTALGNLRNIVSPEVTHVGIGVAREEGSSGALLVTEDFITMIAPISVETSTASLLSSVNERRATRSAAPLVVSTQLQSVASAMAQKFFETDVSKEQISSQADRQVGNVGLLFRRVHSVGIVVNSIDEAKALEPLLDGSVTGVGIGMAQGIRKDAAPGSIFVLFVLGDRR